MRKASFAFAIMFCLLLSSLGSATLFEVFDNNNNWTTTPADGGTVFIQSLVTSFLAILFTILAAGSLAVAGVHDPAMLSIILLLLLGLFVFIGWIALIPFIFVAFASIMTLFLTKAVMG